jgi:hypothetical protein
MLCCAAESIADEYASDDSLSTRKPDLLIFKTSSCVHDTSINVFLALLMTCIEENNSSHAGSYDASIKRHIYHIFSLIATEGSNAESFWTFLMTQGCVSEVPKVTGFRIKGTTSQLSLHDTAKQLIWNELRSLSLGLWTPATDENDGAYTWVNAYTPPPTYAAVQAAQLDGLLLQLKGMVLGM